MKTTVEIGYGYALRSEMGGEVTNAETGKTLETLEPNKQVHMTAQESEWIVPDDCQVTKMRNFNHALASLGLLGGGTDKLPAGFTKLAFLASRGTQGFIVPYIWGINEWCEIEAEGITNGLKGLAGCNEHNFMELYISNSQVDSYQRGAIHCTLNTNKKVSITVNKPQAKTIISDGDNRSEGPIFPGRWVNDGTIRNFGLFGFFDGKASLSSLGTARIYSFRAGYADGSLYLGLAPALDPTGEPCMFDCVSKQPFRSSGSGSFIAGVGTVAQLTTLLRRLPATGGSLSLSLPAEANTPEVAEKLQACHDTKGWTLTVHEYRPAAAATYSLRRVREVVWCRKVQAEHGSYDDSTGTRWQVERCAAIFGAQGQDPTAYGYEPFDGVEQAAEAWGLVPYIDPEMVETAD